MTTPTLTNIEELRRQHYLATVTLRRQVNDELMILRVKPDADEWPGGWLSKPIIVQAKGGRLGKRTYGKG